MPPKPCPSPDELRFYALGDTGEDAARRIEEHLTHCPACEETLAKFDSADDTLVRNLPLAAAAEQEPEEGWLARLRDDVPRLAGGGDALATGASAETEEDAGEFLGSYRLLGRIGRGGMGVVYRALHTQLDRVAAVKVLSPHLVASAAARARFDREIQIVGRLDHPGIVRANDAGRVGRTAYLVMEYVDGVDLARLVRRGGPLPVSEACEAARQVAESLAAAHRRGAVHRDVKPSNLMADRSGQVKLLDFGLARLSAEMAAEQHSTQGRLVGTLEYMAPEQAAISETVDHRADLYALGATLFYLLTGRPPHGASKERPLLAQLRHIAEQDSPRVSELRPEVPAELDELVARLLARRTEDRPASGEEVAASLSRFAGGDLAARVAGFAPPEGDARRADAEEVARAEASLAEQLGEPIDVSGEAPQERTAGNNDTATRRLRAWPLVAVAIAAAFLFVASLGAVLFLQTPEGTLRIESESDDVRVELVDDQGRVRSLEIHQGDKETVLRAGRYRVRIAGGHNSLQITPDEFTLRAGKEVVARIRYEKATPARPIDQSFARKEKASAESIDELFARIEETLATRSWERTATAGGAGGEEFEDLPQSPRLLIGFKATKSTFFAGIVTIKSLQPIYRTPGGVIVEGPRIGRPFRNEVELTARDGYAVGAVIARSGLRVDGFKLRFMRITAGGLDTNDAYDSNWFGGKRGGDEKTYGGDGRPIVGLFGRQGANVDCIGFVIAEFDPDRRAAEWVLSIGGSVRVNDSDRDITQADELPPARFRLTQVDLGKNPQVSDAGLAHFEGCRNLASLELQVTRVGDVGLAHIKDCGDLNYLNLGSTQVSDAGLIQFQDCKKLKVLHLWGTRVSNAGLVHLQAFKNLTFLSLRGAQVSDAGLAHLAGMDQLRELALFSTQVTAQGCAELHKQIPKCTVKWNGGVIEP